MKKFISIILSVIGFACMVTGVVYACSNLLSDSTQFASLVIISVGAAILLTGVITMIISNSDK